MALSRAFPLRVTSNSKLYMIDGVTKAGNWLRRLAVKGCLETSCYKSDHNFFRIAVAEALRGACFTATAQIVSSTL